MDFDNPIYFAVWMLFCFVFVLGAFLLLFRGVFPRMGRGLIDSLKQSGYSREAALKALQGALLPASVKQSLLHYAETVYSDHAETVYSDHKGEKN